MTRPPGTPSSNNRWSEEVRQVSRTIATAPKSPPSGAPAKASRTARLNSARRRHRLNNSRPAWDVSWRSPNSSARFALTRPGQSDVLVSLVLAFRAWKRGVAGASFQPQRKGLFNSYVLRSRGISATSGLSGGKRGRRKTAESKPNAINRLPPNSLRAGGSGRRCLFVRFRAVPRHRGLLRAV